MKRFLVVFLLIFSISRGDILFIGDSMIEAIKPVAQRLCKENAKSCIFLYKRGLRTEKWLKGKYKKELLSVLKLDIDKVVISTGTNDLVIGESNSQIYKEIVRLIYLIYRTRRVESFIVVAPPIPKDNSLNEYLYNHLIRYKIKVIKSKDYNLRLYDGIHPTPRESRK